MRASNSRIGARAHPAGIGQTAEQARRAGQIDHVVNVETVSRPLLG